VLGILALLAFGTIYSWIGLAILSIWIISALEWERGLTLATLALVALVALGNGVSLGPWILHHPVQVIEYVAGWFVAGTVWGVIKWYFFCASVARRYREARAAYFAKYPDQKTLPAMGTTQMAYWTTIRSDYRVLSTVVPPDVADNKARILTWMGYWPWSAFWTIINDPVKRLFKEIYHRIASTLQRISNSMFKYDEFKT
jgi:hypothetical protein